MPFTPRDITEAMFESLYSLIPDPQPSIADAFPPDANLVSLAAATRYVCRIAAVLDRLKAVDVLDAHAAALLAREASDWRHLDRPTEHAGLIAYWELMVAGSQRLIEFVDGPHGEMTSVTAGSRHALPQVHPVAAWGEAIVPALLGDSEGGLLDILAPGILARSLQPVVPLLYEVVVRAQSISEGSVTDVLSGVAQRLRLDHAYRGAFTRRRIAAHVGVMRALMVELGLVTWTPHHGRAFGTIDVTPLGCFGYLIFKAEIGGPRPELDAAIQEDGYIPCEGGYIDTADLPVSFSLN